MAEGTWLRDKAAIVGVGHTPYGKRGEHAEKGHLRLVVEAIVAACADAGISPEDVDGYSSYYTSVEPSDLYAAFGAKRLSYSAQAWGGGGGVDGRGVPNAAMAVATGQAEYVVVHKVMTWRAPAATARPSARSASRRRRPAADGVPGALRAAVAGADVRPGRPPPHAPVRHHHRALRRGDDQRPAQWPHTNPDARFRDLITVEDHHSSPA